ncbi:hypothetical protein RchiOBHm_Chr5g0014511 [Rosa chinensis]|uniref:Uncharacterized protein n=1 Tax=Rosa chinensis TaxID=74649 RepID=A0A2P6Q5P2_ROSCH|nr:hypothetical protein RchiOBHm_Chr5g0014511 [Rosa chinensis]
MDTELPTIKSLPAIIIRRNSSTSSRPDQDIEDDPQFRYTSLKDIILHSPQSSTAVSDEPWNYEFDPSNITIRNQLVKRAASAYVQSAAILACTRNQSILVSFWGRLLRGHCVGLSSGWDTYIRSPIEACLRPILQFFACMVGNVRSTLNNSAS